MTGKDVGEIINACDVGREGELISRSVYNMTNCKKPIKRLWISSMENAAIREGFKNLKDGGVKAETERLDNENTAKETQKRLVNTHRPFAFP